MEVVPIATPRLCLRAFAQADAPDVFAACSNPVLGDSAGWPPHETLEDSLAYIRDIVPLGLVWALCEAGEEEPVIGSVGLLSDPRFPEDAGVLMLGYWLHQDFWGCGYMTEAAQAVLAWARQNCTPTPVHLQPLPGQCGVAPGHRKVRLHLRGPGHVRRRPAPRALVRAETVEHDP